jgi:uncharacterized membrane protein
MTPLIDAILGPATRASQLIPPQPAFAMLLSPDLILGLAIALVVALAAMDFALRLGNPSARKGPADRMEERYWKGGMLYANPDDPALFIEKPSGLGYTLNLGRPAGWAVLAILLLGPLLVIWLALVL